MKMQDKELCKIDRILLRTRTAWQASKNVHGDWSVWRNRISEGMGERAAHFTGLQKIATNQHRLLKAGVRSFHTVKGKGRWPLFPHCGPQPYPCRRAQLLSNGRWSGAGAPMLQRQSRSSAGLRERVNLWPFR